MNENLSGHTIKALAEKYPFSLDDINIVYEALGSWEATKKACELAYTIGASSPVYVIRMIGGKYAVIDIGD